MSEYLPYDITKFDKIVKLEDIFKTHNDSDIGYFIEVDLTYRDKIKEKTKRFPFASVTKNLILIFLVII